jgi:hypothetical protein
MRSRSDFWLTLHKLASDLIKEGETDEERGKNICEVLHAVTPATRHVYLENLDSVVFAMVAVERSCKQKD